jgi:hypothetical protein
MVIRDGHSHTACGRESRKRALDLFCADYSETSQIQRGDQAAGKEVTP